MKGDFQVDPRWRHQVRQCVRFPLFNPGAREKLRRARRQCPQRISGSGKNRNGDDLKYLRPLVPAVRLN